MEFASDAVGPTWIEKSNEDTDDGAWGNGQHIIANRWPFTYPSSFSNRDPIRHGDRKTPLPYGRYGTRVLEDKPIIYRTMGRDGNGDYNWVSKQHQAHWLPNEIWYHPSNPPGFGSIVTNMMNQVNTEIYGKIQDSKIEMGENIGQAVSTADMIAEPFRILLKAYVFARAGNWAGVASLLGKPQSYINGKFIASGWLQYYYGWKPLISDIYGGMKLLNENLGNNERIIRSKKVKSETFEAKGFDNDQFYDADFSFSARYKVSIDYKISSAALHGLDLVGLSNPMQLAWQLMPFSFVIDWFLPVGNVLGGLSGKLGLDFVTGYKTLVEEGTRRSYRNDYGWPSNQTKMDRGLLEIGFKRMQRTPIYTFPMPEMHIRRNPFSTERMTSALALFRQVMMT